MKKFEGIVFGIDFDGTCVLHCFPNVGADVPGAVETLNWIVDNGGKLVINTMRSNKDGTRYLSDAVLWFHKNMIPFWGLNENPTQKEWTSSPKVYAHIYIDDAALGCPVAFDIELCSRPFVDWQRVREILESKIISIEKIHHKTNKL